MAIFDSRSKGYRKKELMYFLVEVQSSLSEVFFQEAFSLFSAKLDGM